MNWWGYGVRILEFEKIEKVIIDFDFLWRHIITMSLSDLFKYFQ